jgi:hypothetical protein
MVLQRSFTTVTYGIRCEAQKLVSISLEGSVG